MNISLKTARLTALTFFSIGTFLFLIQCLSKEDFAFIFLGLIFIIIATIYNFIVFLILLVQLIRKNEIETFFSILIILLNIPIALGYFYILTHY